MGQHLSYNIFSFRAENMIKKKRRRRKIINEQIFFKYKIRLIDRSTRTCTHHNHDIQAKQTAMLTQLLLITSYLYERAECERITTVLHICIESANRTLFLKKEFKKSDNKIHCSHTSRNELNFISTNSSSYRPLWTFLVTCCISFWSFPAERPVKLVNLDSSYLDCMRLKPQLDSFPLFLTLRRFLSNPWQNGLWNRNSDLCCIQKSSLVICLLSSYPKPLVLHSTLFWQF